MTGADPIISLERVTKSFAKAGNGVLHVAVDKLDLRVDRGQLLALLGKTGCGKSTIFNMIAGLTEPSSGSVKVDGRNPFREFELFRGKIAIVFQGDTAAAVANGPPERRARSGDARRARRAAAKGGATLAGYARSARTRARLPARAVGWHAATRFDRAGVCDGCRYPALRRAIFGAGRDDRPGPAGRFVRLVRDNGKTAVFITHSINEALEIGDRLVVLKRPANIAIDMLLTATTPATERKRSAIGSRTCWRRNPARHRMDASKVGPLALRLAPLVGRGRIASLDAIG